MGKIIALVEDLFFRARIAETARHTGVAFEAVGNGKELLERLRAASGAGAERIERPTLIIVDLNGRGGALECLHELKATGNQIPVIAFLSHVQAELAEQARMAGCNEVMPRSKFTRNLAVIMEREKAVVGD